MKRHKKKRRSLYRATIRAYDRYHATVWRARRAAWLRILDVPNLIRQHRGQLISVGKGATAGLCVLLLIVLFAPAPARVSSKKMAVNQPIRVSFLYPAHGELSYTVSPNLDGNWVEHRSIFGITSVEFVPAKPLKSNAAYRVIVTGVRPVIGVPSTSTRAVSFSTQGLQPVRFIRPSTDGNVVATTDIAVSMPYANAGTRHFMLAGDAEFVSAEPSSNDDKLFVWRFKKPLTQGKTYSFVLRDLNLPAGKQVLRRISFTTVGEPRVVSATTGGQLYPGNTIKIVFADKMVQDAHAFTFSCIGMGKWQNDHTYSFMPATLLPNTTCDYMLHKGARSQAGGVVEKDRQFNLGSPGALGVASFSPSGSNLALATNIVIAFDQPVDRVAAQNAFGVAPAVAGNFTWNGNTLTFETLGLAYQTDYTVSLAAGISSVYGLPSTQSYTWHFSTVPQTIKLNVPSYRQAHALGSATTALRMALSYRGMNVSDDDVLQAIGYDPEPRDTAGNYWTDPYLLFVGDVDGSAGVTGWGVLAPPVALATQKLGRNAVYLANITANQVSQAIHDGNAVLLWGVKAGESPHMDSWNTADGLVNVPDNTEVRVVYGVTGSMANPLTFYMHDPAVGDLQWSAAQLKSNMSANGQIVGQGIVVY